MSKERSESRPNRDTETSSRLVDHLTNRRIFRGLHELGDQEMTIALESAAIRVDDSIAQELAKDLRKHLMDNGDESTFFEENPQYKDYDLSHLRPEIEGELMHLADLTPSLIHILPGETTALPSPKKETAPEVETEYEKEISDEIPEDAVEILSERYPKVAGLFANEDICVESPDRPGEKFIPRKAIQDLIVNRKEGTPNPGYTSYAMAIPFTKEWKRIYGSDLGEKISGKGTGKFLSEDETTKLLWLLHTKLGTKGFCTNLTLDDSEPEVVEGKKKLPNWLGRK